MTIPVSPLKKFINRPTNGHELLYEQLIDACQRWSMTSASSFNLIIKLLLDGLLEGHLYCHASIQISHPLISSDPSKAPLVKDTKGQYWFSKHYSAEKIVAECLLVLSKQRPLLTNADSEKISKLLKRLFKQNDEYDWQKIAVAIGLQQNFMMIAGGPGTGKTTTVAKLLALLLSTNPLLEIAIAAPTGKAAARLASSINLQRKSLIEAGIDENLISRIPQHAYTLHRLLNIQHDGTPSYKTEYPLPR